MVDVFLDEVVIELTGDTSATALEVLQVGFSPPVSQAAEEINNRLAEVRKYGQGVILLDQRPGSLVGGVIDNAYLVGLHRLNEQKSFGQFAAMLNLTPQQQRFALVGLERAPTP